MFNELFFNIAQNNIEINLLRICFFLNLFCPSNRNVLVFVGSVEKLLVLFMVRQSDRFYLNPDNPAFIYLQFNSFIKKPTPTVTDRSVNCINRCRLNFVCCYRSIVLLFYLSITFISKMFLIHPNYLHHYGLTGFFGDLFFLSLNFTTVPATLRHYLALFHHGAPGTGRSE